MSAMSGTSAAKRSLLTLAATAVLLVLGMAGLDAHGVSGKDAVFLQGLNGRAIVPLMYLGAKHMVTGYDHLLFLVGVIFFLYRLKDVVQYVSLFTIGHSVTLLAGVLGGIHANPYSDRRDHRLLGRLQGVRQHGRVPALLRLPAEHQGRGADRSASFTASASPPSCRSSRCRRTASWRTS